MSFAEKSVFRFQRLLHLHDHLGLRVNFLRRVDDLRTGIDVSLVGITGTDSRSFLHENAVTFSRESRGRGWNEPDPVLLRFNFFRNADDHLENSDE